MPHDTDCHVHPHPDPYRWQRRLDVAIDLGSLLAIVAFMGLVGYALARYLGG